MTISNLKERVVTLETKYLKLPDMVRDRPAQDE